MSCTVRCLFAVHKICKCSCKGYNHGVWIINKRENKKESEEVENVRNRKSNQKCLL